MGVIASFLIFKRQIYLEANGFKGKIKLILETYINK
jgi:hypothetical protein